MKPLLDPELAAPFIGVTTKTMANWRCQGAGLGPKFLRVGRKIKYDPDDIAEWREAKRVSSTSEPAVA